MGVSGLSMGVVMLSVSVVVLGPLLAFRRLALKCLPFSGLALFRLIFRRMVLRGRVLRIVYCVAFCCVIQVFSLFPCRCPRFWF
jgi:hypothetical protein